jgi:hypothetical protein
VLACACATPTPAAADCTLTSTGNVPLSDLGTGTYQGREGGLYPFGGENPPPAHEAAALAFATDQIKPRNAAGAVDLANGRIVMISVGMSNTTQEFSTFVQRLPGELSDNPKLTVVDGAQGGQDVFQWTSPSASTWQTVNQRLSNAGVTPAQVQVAWIKQAIAGPNNHGAFPLHAEALETALGDVVRALRTNYPNARIAWLSSRTRAYTNVPTALNPEPFAYEAGFATKWLIESQIDGTGNLVYASASPVAPLLLWGPYLWADGTTPRSDSFVWLCSDTQADFTHPSPTGRAKVADQLMAFFKTDPVATPWFLKVNGANPPSITAATATPASGTAPLGVAFAASAQDTGGSIASYAWTFDDGTFSFAQNPAKTFRAGGVYNTHLTVTDNEGNTARAALRVGVSAPGVAIVSPAADAAVQSSSPNVNFGTAPMLQVLGTGSAPSKLTYLRFNVTGAGLVRRAVLHLNVLDPGSVIEVHTSPDTTWNETAITWNSRPPVDAAVAGAFTPRFGGAVEVDVTPALTGAGAVTLVLQSAGSDQSNFASREATNAGARPLLEVRYQ